jgi:acyl dehydratase
MRVRRCSAPFPGGVAEPARDARSPMDPQHLLDRAFPVLRQRYTERDTILYALGVGAAAGAQAWDEHQLRWVYEAQLQALPTMCTMLGDPGFRMREPDTGLEWHRLLHGEEAMQWLQPLPPGARLAALGAPAALALAAVPERTPDLRLVVPTDPRAPLLYRLSTDPNPLHADPAVARAAGFARPTMHDMCTFELLGLLIVDDFCDGDAARPASLRTRFTAPLYPGETLACQFWRDDHQVRFRATALERDTVVLNHGLATLHDPAALSGAHR